jgi:exonuclease III
MRIATWNVNSAKQRLPRLWVELLGGELGERGYELAAQPAVGGYSASVC